MNETGDKVNKQLGGDGNGSGRRLRTESWLWSTHSNEEKQTRKRQNDAFKQKKRTNENSCQLGWFCIRTFHTIHIRYACLKRTAWNRFEYDVHVSYLYIHMFICLNSYLYERYHFIRYTNISVRNETMCNLLVQNVYVLCVPFRFT